MLNLTCIRILVGFGISLLCHNLAQAQLAYSAFTDAAVAYVAVSGPGINFARGNPAALSHAWMPNHAHLGFNLESNQDKLGSPFNGFSLQAALTSRLALGVGRWPRTATTGAHVSGSSPEYPPQEYPLQFIGFGYRQQWSAGMSFRLNSDLSLGLAMRQEEYSALPMHAPNLTAANDYLTFDFGIGSFGNRLNWGVIFRNFYRTRTGSENLQQVSGQLDTGESFAWQPGSFSGITLEPKSAVEAGINLAVSTKVRLLGDVTSRQEYALGVKWQVHPNVLLSTGEGRRFDRIYDRALRYRALGAQYHDKNIALALTWIMPDEKGGNHPVRNSNAVFSVMQITNHQWLMGLAWSY